MIDAACLTSSVEQRPLEAVLASRDDGEPGRVPVPRVVANVRSDTRAVLARHTADLDARLADAAAFLRSR